MSADHVVAAVQPWSASAFEARYRAAADPWNFSASEFEQSRYDAILAGLSRPHYERAYEPGCSIGALTVRLAPRCGTLVAVDVSPTAIGRVRDRCLDLPQVCAAVGSITDAPPDDLDLVMFSEIGYYFSVAELDAIIDQVSGSLGARGELMACHWLGSSADHQLHGSVVHERLHAGLRAEFTAIHHEETPDYVIDSWRRA